MFNFRCLAVLAVLIVSFNTQSTSAVIVEITDSNFPGGTNNVTWDTDTGLQWLDWTASLNISYDDMITMFDVGDTYEGWRHATRDEVREFMANTGLPTTNWPGGTLLNDNLTSYNFFIGLVGETGSDRTTGRTSTPVTGSSTAHYDGAAFEAGTSSGTVGLSQGSDSIPSLTVGHALVRAIPEPSAFLCVGTLALGILGHSRRRNASRG